MTAARGSRRAGRTAAAAVLAAALGLQIVILATGNVARTLERAWAVRQAPALERSARIAFGDEFSEFVSFIREVVPESAKLVVPPKTLDSLHGDIGLMQYFLRPRTIIDCPLGEDMGPCLRSLTGTSTYILAVPSFPPSSEARLYRDLLVFRDERGVYVPRGAAGLEAPDQRPDAGASAATLVADLLIVVGIWVLGILLVRAVAGNPDAMLAAAFAFPLGLASLTCVLFLLSWAGVPLVSWTVAASGALLGVMFALVARVRRRARAGAPTAQPESPGALAARSAGAGWTICLVVIAAALLISVMRSYSTWDDMGAYAIQGYGIAREGSLEAVRSWGPVAASYPPNIPLAISLFHFADGDVLPGSKLLFPFFLGAILLAGYRLWRRAGHTDLWAAALALALGTIPLVFDHGTTGYTNLPFAAYLVLGCALFLEGAGSEDWRSLLLGGLSLAGAIWTRPEGLLIVWGLVPVLLATLAVRRRGRTRLLVVLLPLVLTSSAWLVYGAQHGSAGLMPGTLSAWVNAMARGDLHLSAPYWTLRYLGRSLIDPSVWGLFLPLGIMLLLLGSPAWRSREQWLARALFVGAAAESAAVFVFYYLVSFSNDLAAVLGTGVERMFLPACLLAWFGLGAMAAPQRQPEG